MNRGYSLYNQRRNYDYGIRNRNSSMVSTHNNKPVKSPYTGASISKIIITNYFRLEFEKKLG